ncbi:MAG TPA: DNA recombination protein RmuC [Sphingomicrobium sp.]|nr:DNA recombination protein RmuC [Sphingomicrobium sp.]
MDVVIAIILALGAVVAGVLTGWWLANRSSGPLKRERDEARSDAEEWRVKFNEAVVNLAAEAEKNKRLEEIDAQLATEREAAASLRAEVAAFTRGEAERERSHQEQVKQLADLKIQLEAKFGELAGQAVETAHATFLKRADEKLGATAVANEAKLKNLLQPVEATLKRYEQSLGEIEKARNASYGELNKAVELLRADQSSVRQETARLVNALRSNPKTRGRWGEESLKNVLEQAGLNPYCDYRAEVTVATDDGQLRPDVVVRLPGGGHIVIDAKCSLNAYLDSCDEVDEAARILHLKSHLGSIKSHVQKLSSKSYWQQFGETADFVVMYIPGEHFLTAALEQDARDHNDPPLWDWARQRRVLLATPTNLLVLARLAATYWRQDQQTKEAAEIAKLGKELHSRLATMAEHVGSVGTNLSRMNNAYNKMVGSLESQVFTQARRFEDYGAASPKEIVAAPIIDASPRTLTKLSVVTTDPQENIAEPSDKGAAEA